MRHYFLVAYDISSDKRWRKVFKIMKGHGEHVQYSVFLCQLTAKEKAELENLLYDAVNHREDQVLLIHLATSSREQVIRRISAIGRKYEPLNLNKMIF